MRRLVWENSVYAAPNELSRRDRQRNLDAAHAVPIDYLDFASPESGLGSKIGLDATNKLPPETKTRMGQEDRDGPRCDPQGH